jgi:pimeloyl-ACP methyl ester carboxylesterase
MLVYLHGFASGPGSTKGRILAERFATTGRMLEGPDLTPGPDGFERSTIASMLAHVTELLDGAPPPHALIGSSMGGYLATLLASRDPRVERLVLLAPAFRMAERWRARLSAEEFRGFQEEGSIEVFHYGTRTQRRIGYALLEDLDRQSPYPEVKVPTLCIAGLRDDVVPIEDVERFVARTPAARLLALDDGHELSASIDRIWDEASEALRPYGTPVVRRGS